MEKKGYNHSLEHIIDELKCIDVMIRRLFLRVNRRFKVAGEHHGLYISDQEIEHLLSHPVGAIFDDHVAPSAEEQETFRALESMRATIEGLKALSMENGRLLSLHLLAQRFNLNPWDVDLLLVCLAPEMDLSYERIYAYIQDDLTRKKPTVDLALNVVAGTFSEKMMLRRRLEPGCPLIDFKLIHVHQETGGQETGLIGRTLKVDDRIVSFLLEEDVDDAVLAGAGLVRLVQPGKTLNDLILDGETLSRIERIVHVIKSRNQSIVFYVYGPYGTGKKSVGEAVCQELNSYVLYVDVKRILEDHGLDFKDIMSRIVRETVLRNACVFFENADLLFEEGKAGRLNDFITVINQWNGLFFMGGKQAWEPADVFEHKRFFSLKFDLPSMGDRCKIWQRLLDDGDRDASLDVDALSSAFAFSGGRIRDALNSARNLALKRPVGPATISSTDLYEACRLQSNQKLSALSRKLQPIYSWDDIVLPRDRFDQLKEITHHVRYRSLVYGTWGFGKKLSYGKGLHVLFAGPSGTGKTMAAEIMAQDLGLDIYKIDLARIVSKYIGETEKNLSHIFDEAETSHAILFFDEADAIFGKRSEIHDSHDRYANIETSYLLQKMEEYEGMTILSTNFRRNMDEAFVRRIQFAVEFPFPDAVHRKRIWEKIWPTDMPMEEGIDFNLLARRFEMTGGNIRNISLHAAFIAAADGHKVTMPHLVKATQREYQKMGKLMMGHEFADLLKA